MQHAKRRVRQRRDEWIGRPGKVFVSDDDERRAGDAPNFFGGVGLDRPPQDCGHRERIVAGAASKLYEEPSGQVVRVVAVLERVGEHGTFVVPKEIGADTDDDEATEPLRRARRDAQQELRTQREADRVDGLVGKGGFDGAIEMRVVLRIVRSRRRAVSENVDRHRAAACIAQQVDPAGRAPTVFRRRSEAVNEGDRLRTHPRIVSGGRYRAPVTDLSDFAHLAAADGGLAVVVTTRADNTAQASLVSAGVADNPISGRAAAAFVVHGAAHKLVNMRRRPHTTICATHGYQWATVEGPATIIGLDDPQPGFDDDAIRVLLRTVFTAAGGTHDDWDEYDRVMRADRRAAVFVEPARVYSNG